MNVTAYITSIIFKVVVISNFSKRKTITAEAKKITYKKNVLLRVKR